MTDRAQADWIAADWGTTHLRVWIFGPGEAPLARLGSDDGMGRLAPDEFEGALLRLVEPHLAAQRRTPVICCGMVGARQGWREAPYAEVPCAPPGGERAAEAPARDPRLAVRILPGVMQPRPPDVMRGEETQVAGFLSANPQFDGVICLPGTHTKWVHVSAGEIVSFRTFMSGELYSLLATQSVLRHAVAPGAWDDAAFASGLGDAIARPQTVGAELFSLRAASLLHDLPAAAATSRLSGLLIGLELGGARPYWLGQRIALIGSENLSRIYAQALAAQGAAAETADGEEMTIAGLRAAYEHVKETLT